MRRLPRVVIFAAALLVSTFGSVRPVAAATTMQIRLGWDGLCHADRWNVAFVTLSDPTPRNVTVEFHAPYDGFHGLGIGQAMTIGPQPQTFPLYLPLRAVRLEDVSVTVRDARSRKRLAVFPSSSVLFTGGVMTDSAKTFVGVSGRRATLRSAIDGVPGAMIQSGYLDPADLPADAIGYDCLDVLVLNAPNFTALSDEQHQALADWVRSGGNLLLWPSEDPVPASSPLLDILPARIGASLSVELAPDVLQKAGLSPRFRKLPARELAPTPDAEPFALLGTDRLTAYRRRVGFGRVVICPTELTAQMFNDPRAGWRVWRTVLQGMVANLPEPDAAAKPPPASYYGYGRSPDSMREANALSQVGDLLGNVPGAGRFGFGYIASVLIGMMAVVGPLDWFVLKKLGRQPWTWVTTTGWVALVTLSAVYAGHLLKSGELHFRTFQVADQADGMTVSRTDLAALYSPRTTEYDLQAPLESWWQPASPGDNFYGYRAGVGREVPFHQTYRGNRPDPMVVNVWNLRFLKGRATKPAPPLVEADLSVVRRGEGAAANRLVGTVKNVGPAPLKNVAVRTKEGICVFELRAPGMNRIEPGQAVSVDAVIDPEMQPKERDPNDPRYGYPGYMALPPMLPTRMWEAAGYLAARRTEQVRRWLAERDDVACVYGEFEKPDPVARLKGAAPLEQHYMVVRALVPLKRGAVTP